MLIQHYAPPIRTLTTMPPIRFQPCRQCYARLQALRTALHMERLVDDLAQPGPMRDVVVHPDQEESEAPSSTHSETTEPLPYSPPSTPSISIDRPPQHTSP